MELEDLLFESDNFYEQEMIALRNLPKDESGLDRLMAHISKTDSYFAWMFLFDGFGDILEESVRKSQEKQKEEPAET